MKGAPPLLLAAATVGLGFTVERDASSPVAAMVWPGATATMVLHLEGSDDVTDGSDLTAIRNAMAAWNAPACSRFTFVDGGTSSTRGDADDGVSRISIIESGWPAGYSGAVALTALRIDATPTPAVWREADVMLNGQDFTFATDGRVQAHDIQSTLTHELGHVLGLAHASTPESTMYFGGRRGRTAWRTLAPDDVRGVCFLYPTAGFACSGDAECPLYDNLYYSGSAAAVATHCDGDSCVAGASAYGAPCFDDGDCQSGQCLTGLDAAPAYDPGFCTQTCTPGSCPNGDRCDDLLGDWYCFVGYDDCIEAADCPTDWVCQMDLDTRFRCLELCLRDAQCSDIPSAICHGGTGASPAAYCRVPGAAELGNPCEHGLECESLYCAGGGTQPTCSAPPVLASPDGGPSPDGGVADEPTPSDAPGGDPTPSESLPGDEIVLDGGCACSSGSAAAAPLLASVWVWRRRRGQRR